MYTPEVGLGGGSSGASRFARLVLGASQARVDDLLGFGISASGNALGLSGSYTIPVDGQGYHLDKAIGEIGIATGAASFSGTFGGVLKSLGHVYLVKLENGGRNGFMSGEIRSNEPNY